MKRTLRVGYADFWGTFSPADNFFSRLLSRNFNLELSDEPELLIHSCYGGSSPEHRKHTCLKLFVNWENRGWGFSETDLAITCDYLNHNDHFRFPLYAADLRDPFVQPSIDVRDVLHSKKGFASVVVSNPKGATRNRLHGLLDSYSEVASGGRFRNNVGGPVEDKMSFISGYKFCIACENSSYPGYTTEKLTDALRANTIPIYWGNPQVEKEFNNKRILSVREFSSDKALLQRITELHQDDAAYCDVIQEPWFVKGRLPADAHKERLLEWLTARINDGRTPVAQRVSLMTPVRRIGDRCRQVRRSRFRRS